MGNKEIMKSLLTYILILSMALLSAQSLDKTVFANAGNTMTDTKVSIAFTIGEPLIGTVQNDASINQGFWGGSLIVEPITAVADLNGIIVYPNPVIDNLNLYTGGNKVYGITLFGIDGKRALKQKVDTSLLEHSINLSYLRTGIYVMRLFIEGSSEEKLFKIIKK